MRADLALLKRFGFNAIRTAHLAGLLGRRAIAPVPPGAADGDPVELVPLPH